MASSGGVQQRLPSRLDPPIGFAHRGAKAHAPENTIEAFQLALRLGATGLESDVWLTAEGIPVLVHDGALRRGLRKRPISSIGVDELPPHIPRLVELLDTCGTDYQLSLDAKSPDSARAIVEVIAQHSPDMVQRTWVCEKQFERAADVASWNSGIQVLQTTRLDKISEGPERRADRLKRAGIDGINMHRTDWNGGLVALVHRFELYAFGWDMQQEHELRAGIRMGLDAVYSDDVDVLEMAMRAELSTGE
ncbi:MAG: glycerophosphodiester phosphodiesterase [Actinomycetota bacterium]